MSKRSAITFTRRAPDNLTEELVAVLSSKDSFEFKPLFEIILLNLRERNAANGGEELLRLRAYEKLQGLVYDGAVNRTVTGTTKKYKGDATRIHVKPFSVDGRPVTLQPRPEDSGSAQDGSLLFAA